MIEWDLHTGPRGLRLRVCEWGDPDGPPVVILHGFLEQGASWDPVARRMPGYRILAPDQRGFGLSDHIGTGGFYHFWDYSADVDALARHLRSPFHLIGHSMGGSVAGMFAGLRPDAVRSLTVIEGLGPPDDRLDALTRARRYLDDRADPAVHRPMADLEDAANRMLRANGALGPELARFLAARTTRPEGDGLVWTWDPLHRARSPHYIATDLFQRLLAAITAPTLVIEGARSWSPQDVDARYASLNHARRLSLDGGHMLHHEVPEDLAAHLCAHLDGHR